jgi:hypothetical protein
VLHQSSYSYVFIIILVKSMDADDDENGTPTYRPRQYPLDHRGPYEVFIRQIETPIKHFEISKKINDSFKGAVLSLVKINVAKIKVVFKDRSSANKIHEMTYLRDYRVYIPAANVEINGIITVSHDSSENDLVEEGKGKFRSFESKEVNILEAYRFTKKITDADNNIVQETPTSAVRVTFEGTRLPDFVVIFGLAVPVKPHVEKIMHCKNCLNFGHTEKFCTAKPTCKKCGGPHDDDSCNAVPHICIHCKKPVDHSRKQDCPVYNGHLKKLIKKSRTRGTQENIDQNNSLFKQQNFYSILSSQSNSEPNEVMPSTSSPRKRRCEDPNDNSIPQAASPKKTFTFGKQNPSFAEVASGKVDDTQANNKQPKNRSNSSKTKKKKESTIPKAVATAGGSPKPSIAENVGGNVEPTTGNSSEDLEKKKLLKDAIHARVEAFKPNPFLLSIISLLVPKIVDFFWPIISSFVPFLLPLLTQHGQC